MKRQYEPRKIEYNLDYMESHVLTLNFEELQAIQEDLLNLVRKYRCNDPNDNMTHTAQCFLNVLNTLAYQDCDPRRIINSDSWIKPARVA